MIQRVFWYWKKDVRHRRDRSGRMGALRMRYLITGGAGFIGSAVVRHLIGTTNHEVVVVDKLTYAGNLESLAPVADDSRYRFVQGDIADGARMRDLIEAAEPDIVMHLAAETHVDRSIDAPAPFIATNVVGTRVLLDASLVYWRQLPASRRDHFRFHHVSTEEVFGSLVDGEPGFHEESPYRPSSPYAASKAASDHLVRAWHHTYGLPVVLSHCSNNYGPYQFPEKLIPMTVVNCLEGKPIGVYGNGEGVRDWLFVEDHVGALLRIADKGQPGRSYNVGGNCERINIDVVREICSMMDDLAPNRKIGRHENLISFVPDRPGHDFRYAVNAARIRDELGWVPKQTFASGIESTVRWYLDNRGWWMKLRATAYGGERLGLAL